tara:strand:+ start:177 stop:503 length:327 start_codon:yes stop_codon:yes gene_type:complete
MSNNSVYSTVDVGPGMGPQFGTRAVLELRKKQEQDRAKKVKEREDLEYEESRRRGIENQKRGGGRTKRKRTMKRKVSKRRVSKRKSTKRRKNKKTKRKKNKKTRRRRR